MNYHEFEPDKHEEKMNREEDNFWWDVDCEAHDLAKQNGTTDIVRITERTVYDRVKVLVGFGPVSYGDAKASFIQGFMSKQNTWYSLMKTQTSI